MYIHFQTMSCISSLRAQGYDSQSDSVSYVSLYMHERLYARGCISGCLVCCSFLCTAMHTPYPLDTYAVWLRTLHRAPSGTCVSVLSSGFLRDPCECVLPIAVWSLRIAWNWQTPCIMFAPRLSATRGSRYLPKMVSPFGVLASFTKRGRTVGTLKWAPSSVDASRCIQATFNGRLARLTGRKDHGGNGIGPWKPFGWHGCGESLATCGVMGISAPTNC